MGFFNDHYGTNYNVRHNTSYNSQSNSTYSYNSYSSYQCAEEQHENIRGLAVESRNALTRQDRKIERLATEREDAYKIYKTKRDDHIIAKKDRVGINKNVKYAEKAFGASKRKILALNRMDKAGPKKAQKFEADFYRAQGDVDMAMNSYDDGLMDRLYGSRSRSGTPPMKIEEDEDRVSYVSSDEDCDDERDSDYYPQRSPRPSVDGRKRNRYGQFC